MDKSREEWLNEHSIRAQYELVLAYGREYSEAIARRIEAIFWQGLQGHVRPKWVMPEKPILKVLRNSEWEALRTEHVTAGAPIDISDGYIHFSTPEQVNETVVRHFAGEQDLWLLTYDAASFGAELVYEASRGGQLFPHLYAPLRLVEACLVRPWS